MSSTADPYLSKTRKVIYFYDSPIGFLEIQLKGGCLFSVSKVRSVKNLKNNKSKLKSCALMKDVYCLSSQLKHIVSPAEVKLVCRLARQLKKYFSGGKITKWSLPLAVRGTAFQQKVWQALSCIPYGQTISYTGLAKKAGFPKALRAVGSACGKNPWLIVVPCHRVLAKRGLGGFALGLAVKRHLLHRENILV